MNTTTRSIEHQAWDDIPADSKTVVFGTRHVLTSTGLTEWEGPRPGADTGSAQPELKALAQKYPERDSRGYVIGYYNYSPMGEQESGPHATIAEAEEAQRGLGIGPYNIICGHIFTTRGTIIRDN